MKTTARSKSMVSIIGAVMVGALFLLGTNAPATVLFQENFDNNVYTDNGNIPSGFGKINYGEWITYGGQPIITPTSPALSPTRSMEIGPGYNMDAVFGTDNTQATPTTKAIDFRLAIRSPDVGGTFVTILDSDGNNLSNVSFGYWVSGQIDAYFTGQGRVPLLNPIVANTWYYLDTIMPANPTGVNDSYTVKLFQSDGTSLITSATGYFNTETTSHDYKLVYFYQGAGANPSFIDNVSVTEIIPEPASLGLLAIGGLLLWIRRPRAERPD